MSIYDALQSRINVLTHGYFNTYDIADYMIGGFFGVILGVVLANIYYSYIK